MNLKTTTALAVFAALIFSSCAGLKSKAGTVVPVKSNVQIVNDRIVEPSNYVLGPDDIVRVIIEQHPEWSGEYTIRPDGTIFIPTIGDVYLNGLYKEGAEIALSTVLDKYINNPKVSVLIVKYASQVVYVLGEVNRPGKYTTDGKSMTLRDAIVTAGLPTKSAALTRVYVITPGQGNPSQIVINANRILYHGDIRRNIQLKPGDIVYVPQNIWGRIADFIGVLVSPLSSARTAVAPY